MERDILEDVSELDFEEISLINLKRIKQQDQCFKRDSTLDFIPGRKHLPTFMFYHLYNDINYRLKQNKYFKALQVD